MGKRLITLVTVVLLLCLKGCIIVNPQVLDFGSETILIKIQLELVLVSSWEIESSESWLLPNPESGNTSREVWVYVERSGLLPGKYTAELKVHGVENGLVTARVRVGMEVVEGWNGDIEGYVYDEDTGDGIEGAVVRLRNKRSFVVFETSTDLGGYYEFNLMSQSDEGYAISVSKEGYVLNTGSVEPIGGSVVQQDIYLNPRDTNDVSVSIEALPAEGFAPLQVQFSAVPAGGDAPYAYSWDFDDGGSSSEQNPTHVFNTAGEFLVTATVTDDQGDDATDSVTIDVSSPPVTTSSSTTTTIEDLPATTTTTIIEE